MPNYLSHYATAKYDALPVGESNDSTTLKEVEVRMRQRSHWAVNFWIVTTVFFASLSTWLGAELHSKRVFESFDKGFSTELRKSGTILFIIVLV
jgi:hypothetical protein